jgi:hypothetical protein
VLEPEQDKRSDYTIEELLTRQLAHSASAQSRYPIITNKQSDTKQLKLTAALADPFTGQINSTDHDHQTADNVVKGNFTARSHGLRKTSNHVEISNPGGLDTYLGERV